MEYIPGSVQKMCRLGTLGHGLGFTVVLGWWLDSMLEVFSTFILRFYEFSNHFLILNLWERSNAHHSHGRTCTFGLILLTGLSEFGTLVPNRAELCQKCSTMKLLNRDTWLIPFVCWRIISNQMSSGLFCNIIQTAQSGGANIVSCWNRNGTVSHFLLFLVTIWNSLTLAKSVALYLSKEVHR